ncbi:MAG: cytochrome c [Acidimicrobiales bacterium]|nr:cytochrome c [Acidimicrobiales bacterium]
MALRLAPVAVALALALAACGSDGGEALPPLSPAGERGQTVASENGCTSCHTADGARSTGPTWRGLAGSEVELDDGETVVADEDYLRRAIVDARSEVVDGFANIMPVYDDVLTEAEVDDLLAYLHDLGVDAKGEPEG